MSEMHIPKTTKIEPTPTSPYQPHFDPSPPAHSVPEIQATFDEFIPFINYLDVVKYESKVREPTQSNIYEASKSMLTKSAKETSSYCFSLCDNVDLYNDIKLPTRVQMTDLYTIFERNLDESDYLKRRGKIFQGFHAFYESPPQTYYGGLSKWIKVITGTLVVTIFKPTQRNLLKCSVYEPDLSFVAEDETKFEFTLDKDSLFIIPGGWIVIIKATKPTFILTGEYLDIECSPSQFDSFERDVIATEGRYSLDRDREIRVLYWLAAAHVSNRFIRDEDSHENSQNRQILKSMKSLFGALKDWSRKIGTCDSHPNVYAPINLQAASILQDLKSITNDNVTARKRKATPITGPQAKSVKKSKKGNRVLK